MVLCALLKYHQQKQFYLSRASWFLPSVLLGAIQGEISLFLIMILCYLEPATSYSSQFMFQECFPKAVFGFTQALRRFSAELKWYLLLCYTLLWFKRHCLGIPQFVDLLNMMLLYPASRGFSLVFLSIELPLSSRFWLLGFCFGCFCAEEKTSADSRLGFLLSVREMKMRLPWNFWVTCQ